MLVGETVFNRMVNVDSIRQFADLDYLYPTPHFGVWLILLGYCSVRWGMAKFKMAMLGYCLVICRFEKTLIVVKDRVSSKPIPELMKSYIRQTSLPFPLPTAYNTRVYPSTFQPGQQLAQPQAPPPVRAQSNSPILHWTTPPQADQKLDNASPKRAVPYQSYAPAESLPSRTTPRNPFINESTKYHPGIGMLCIKCGDLGHKSNVCTKPAITKTGSEHTSRK